MFRSGGLDSELIRKRYTRCLCGLDFQCFLVLPVECYTSRWLRIAGDHIGRTVKVDFATLLASRGKFARVCIEIDLDKPLMAGYKMSGEYYKLQYEGLHDLCFGCGRYGHRYPICPERTNQQKDDGGEGTSRGGTTNQDNDYSSAEAGYGEWTNVQRSKRRTQTTTKGTHGISSKGNNGNSNLADGSVNSGDNQANSKQNQPNKANARMSNQEVGANEEGKSARGSRGDSSAKDKEQSVNGAEGGSRFASLTNLSDKEDKDESRSHAVDEGMRIKEADLKGGKEGLCARRSDGGGGDMCFGSEFATWGEDKTDYRGGEDE